jgi:hypothetical protein
MSTERSFNPQRLDFVLPLHTYIDGKEYVASLAVARSFSLGCRDARGRVGVVVKAGKFNPKAVGIIFEPVEDK